MSYGKLQKETNVSFNFVELNALFYCFLRVGTDILWHNHLKKQLSACDFENAIAVMYFMRFVDFDIKGKLEVSSQRIQF